MCLQVTREIKIHSALRHAHIIDLYAAFEDADNVYLVQEFAYGACTHCALCCLVCMKQNSWQTARPVPHTMLCETACFRTKQAANATCRGRPVWRAKEVWRSLQR